MINGHGLAAIFILIIMVVACGRNESLSYTALSATAAPVSSDGETLRDGPLGPIVFAEAKTGTQPVEPRRHFKTGTGIVYAFFDFRGVRPDDRITGRWFRSTELLLEQSLKPRDIFQGSAPTAGHLWLSIRFPKGAAAGSYRLDLSVNNEPTDSASFAVEGDPTERRSSGGR